MHRNRCAGAERGDRGLVLTRNRRLVEFVERDAGAEVLVVTNMWPEQERPVYGIFVRRQVHSLRALGVRCDVLYVRGHASPLAYLTAPVRFAYASFAWRRRYKLVHVHAGETSVAARSFIGVPMVVTYWGDDILGNPREDGSIPLSSRLRSALVRSLSLTFAATITESRQMHERLPSASRRRNRVVPSGVDGTLFRPLDRAAQRAALGWDPEQHVVLFAGTRPNSPRKRRTLAEAAVREATAILDRSVRLHVSGGIDAASSVPPERMPVLLNASDCVLLTSSMEGSPNVVKEALMCRVPVVATPAGDVEELLAGVDPSFVCPPDAVALGRAVAECIARGERSNGREAAARVELRESALAILDVYRTLGVEPSDGEQTTPKAVA